MRLALTGRKTKTYLLFLTHERYKLRVAQDPVSAPGCYHKPLEDAVDFWTRFECLDELLEIVEVQITTILTICLLEEHKNRKAL